MKISVVLPVHNTEKQLTKCIESILTQTLKDIELIIINDASPDRSLEIIRFFARQDERITVFNLEDNVGVSRARNLGLKRAQGEYVYFPDSDDYIDKDMLRSMYEAAAKNNCDMAVCNYRRVFDNHSEGSFLFMPEKRIIDVSDNDGEFVRDILGERKHIGGCVFNKLFNTCFLKKSGVLFTDREEIFAEDAYFYFMLLPKLNRICIIDKPLYSYYQRSSSVSHTYKSNLPDKCKRFLDGLNRHYKNLPYYKQIKGDLDIRAFSFYLEILYNETLRTLSYKNFKTILCDSYFKSRLKDINVSALPFNKRVIYYLYRYKLYFIVYLSFMYRTRS